MRFETSIEYLIEKLSYFQFLNKKIIFLKFFIVGGFCGFLDLLLLYFFTDILHIWYFYSGIIAFMIISIVSFLLNKNITFQDKNKNHVSQYAKYAVIILVGMAINNSFLYIFTDIVGIWYIISRVFSSLIALTWNYTMSKKIIFLNKKYA